MKRVRIVSDGTARGTRVLDAETGQPLPGVVSLSLEVVAGSPAVLARVTQLYRVDDLDVEADLQQRSVAPPARAASPTFTGTIVRPGGRAADPADPAVGD